MSSNGSVMGIVFVGAAALVVGAVQCSANCGSPGAELTRAIESQGMTDVRVGDWAFAACSKDDSVARHFTATNPAGKHVSGVVCCGLVFKSCTVRW